MYAKIKGFIIMAAMFFWQMVDDLARWKYNKSKYLQNNFTSCSVILQYG